MRFDTAITLKLLLVFLILNAGINAVWAQNTQGGKKQAEDAMGLGEHLLFIRDYDGAINAFSRAIKITGGTAPYYVRRANCFLLMGEREKAQQDLDKAIALNPKECDAYFLRGELYCDKDQYDLAISDLNKAIQLNPKRIGCYSTRGTIYAAAKQYDKAIADWSKQIEVSPHPSAYRARARLYHIIGKNELALADYASAVKTLDLSRTHSDNYMTFEERGQVLFELRQYQRAVEDFTMCLKLSPQNGRALTGRAKAYRGLGKLKLAIADETEARRIDDER